MSRGKKAGIHRERNALRVSVRCRRNNSSIILHIADFLHKTEEEVDADDEQEKDLEREQPEEEEAETTTTETYVAAEKTLLLLSPTKLASLCLCLCLAFHFISFQSTSLLPPSCFLPARRTNSAN